MREKDYVVIIGSANIDVAGYSHESLNYADSNPGIIKFTPGARSLKSVQKLLRAQRLRAKREKHSVRITAVYITTAWRLQSI